MATVHIDNSGYEVPDEVFLWMKQARDIVSKVKRVRELQKYYFSNRTQDNLARSKAAERELDLLLDGKTQQKISNMQGQLFK